MKKYLILSKIVICKIVSKSFNLNVSLCRIPNPFFYPETYPNNILTSMMKCSQRFLVYFMYVFFVFFNLNTESLKVKLFREWNTNKQKRLERSKDAALPNITVWNENQMKLHFGKDRVRNFDSRCKSIRFIIKSWQFLLCNANTNLLTYKIENYVEDSGSSFFSRTIIVNIA